MTNPLVSVVLPVYNAEKFVAEAIDSILKQTFRNFELLIIDDGSTDMSPTILEQFAGKDDSVKIIRHKHNQGLIATLNEGFKLARGKYIARMDADDIADLKRFEKQVAFLGDHPSTDVVATFIDIFDDATGKSLQLWPEEKQAVTPEEIKRMLPKASCIAHPTIMGRADVLREYGYRPSQKKIEDYDLWLRLVADGKVISKIPEKLLRYRFSKESVTGSDNGEKRLLKAKFRFLLFRIRTLHLSRFDLQVAESLARAMYHRFRANLLRRINARMK